ncbi:MAG: hypothetical protein LVS60_02175 [Nodosilinea sp. LVE1205-7]|jgi:hypothetical protein
MVDLEQKLLLGSTLCKQADFSASWYNRWRRQIANAAHELDPESRPVWDTVWRGMTDTKTMHRKLWEWCAIAQVLEERGMLTADRKGIGFAVGQEPLASLFASRNVELIASDFIDNTPSQTWGSTGQLAVSLESIHWPGFLPFDDFCDRVTYQNIDMRQLGDVPLDAFDFSWSSCSFEHLGSLEAGIQFLINSMACLRKGGVAVHTTEFNVSSNQNTIEIGDSVIYRRKDIESLDCRLRRIGCALEAMDFDPGTAEHDVAFDQPPYYEDGRQHIKLQIGDYVSTSMLLIIRKWV